MLGAGDLGGVGATHRDATGADYPPVEGDGAAFAEGVYGQDPRRQSSGQKPASTEDPTRRGGRTPAWPNLGHLGAGNGVGERSDLRRGRARSGTGLAGPDLALRRGTRPLDRRSELLHDEVPVRPGGTQRLVHHPPAWFDLALAPAEPTTPCGSDQNGYRLRADVVAGGRRRQ